MPCAEENDRYKDLLAHTDIFSPYAWVDMIKIRIHSKGIIITFTALRYYSIQLCHTTITNCKVDNLVALLII